LSLSQKSPAFQGILIYADFVYRLATTLYQWFQEIEIIVRFNKSSVTAKKVSQSLYLFECEKDRLKE
jgi:hypothetical protein